MTNSPLLVRLDFGNDAKETLETLRKNQADFIIKRNLRQESKEDWLLDAQAFGEWREPREGKRNRIIGSLQRRINVNQECNPCPEPSRCNQGPEPCHLTNCVDVARILLTCPYLQRSEHTFIAESISSA